LSQLKLKKAKPKPAVKLTTKSIFNLGFCWLEFISARLGLFIILSLSFILAPAAKGIISKLPKNKNTNQEKGFF